MWLLRSNMHSHSILSFFFITMILLVFYHLNCEAGDSINVENPLNGSRETLVSAGKRFELGFFTPEGNDKSHNRYVGIWYYELTPTTIVWVANRDNPVSDSCEVFRIADDGNLEIWCKNGDRSSITNLQKSTNFDRTLRLVDSGNLILFHGREILWQSFDFPTDTFLPGMEMNDNMELTSWISSSNPGRGNYTFRRAQDLYNIYNGSKVHWKSGWLGPNGTFIYNELPNVVAQILSGYHTQLDQENNLNISFPNVTWASYYNNSRLLMNASGEIKYYYNNSLLWLEPKNFCSKYDACGKFGICDIENERICQCLPGFRLGRYSDGCERESTLSQDDEFLNLNLAKIGGQVTSFHQAQGEATCRNECLSRPKCEAYIYEQISKRAVGDPIAMCYIWTDLENLQKGYTDDGVCLSLRVPFSYIAKPASRICLPCLNTSIPYPLSIQPNCGDPSYSGFYCNNSTGEISFQALSGNYPVIDIDLEKHSFNILVNSPSADICNGTELSQSVNFTVNPTLPFYFTRCYNFRANPGVRSAKIEIGWEPPSEPVCKMSTDCKDWPNSHCQEKVGGERRCHCNQGFGWDGLNVNCTEAPTDLQKGSEESKNKLLTRYVIVLTALLVGVILVCSSYILYRRRRMVEGSGNQGSIETIPVLFSYERERQVNDMMHEKDNAIDVPFYNFDTILSATDNFSDANKLGRGGFGPVYKAKFPGGREIAVKRLSSCSVQGIDEFLNEVNLIAKLQHRNLWYVEFSLWQFKVD
ncbi:Non-specific serine/threonine protein kinase [Handroanthus impetiginosus]|uniref:Receptor-like serine/threonine-protein kinase n=1 Tax=Handroanthus impetiginosus TaxID=429701 RepID=A0A2G9GMC6_9LAMI|nr:Non-specific serine/threonine protein kinase [Handroanthus impetiginosus]